MGCGIIRCVNPFMPDGDPVGQGVEAVKMVQLLLWPVVHLGVERDVMNALLAALTQKMVH